MELPRSQILPLRGGSADPHLIEVTVFVAIMVLQVNYVLTVALPEKIPYSPLRIGRYGACGSRRVVDLSDPNVQNRVGRSNPREHRAIRRNLGQYAFGVAEGHRTRDQRRKVAASSRCRKQENS